MAKMNELAPFLLLKPGKEFETLRNSYIESLTTNLMSYQSRLVQVEIFEGNAMDRLHYRQNF